MFQRQRATGLKKSPSRLLGIKSNLDHFVFRSFSHQTLICHVPHLSLCRGGARSTRYHVKIFVESEQK